MIADTDFVIDLMRAKTAASYLLENILEPLYVSTITLFELYRGLMCSFHPRRELKRIRAVLKIMLLLEFTSRAAELGGKIDGRLIRKGEKIQSQDCMIAGVALEHSLPLITHNVKHYSRIEELQLVHYSIHISIGFIQ